MTLNWISWRKQSDKDLTLVIVILQCSTFCFKNIQNKTIIKICLLTELTVTHEWQQRSCAQQNISVSNMRLILYVAYEYKLLSRKTFVVVRLVRLTLTPTYCVLKLILKMFWLSSRQCLFIHIFSYYFRMLLHYIGFFSTQGERTFSEEEEEKLQAALSLDKNALNLVLETSAFILEQVSGHIVFPAVHIKSDSNDAHFAYFLNILIWGDWHGVCTVAFESHSEPISPPGVTVVLRVVVFPMLCLVLD